mgnify:CR=1 FL=1
MIDRPAAGQAQVTEVTRIADPVPVHPLLDGLKETHPALVDRIGAGDAFLGVTSLCAVQQIPLDILGFIGNVVGSEAVAIVGNRESIEQVPLCRHIEHLLK